jgi:hypothetical protein
MSEKRSHNASWNGQHHLGMLKKGDIATVIGLAETNEADQTAMKMR